MPTLAVIWRAAGLVLATDAASVIEVLPPVACRPVPGVPEWIRGLFTHRGELIPLITAQRLLSGLASSPAPPSADNHAPPTDRLGNRVLVLRITGSADIPPWRAGLWVESIIELARVEFSGAGAHPGFLSEAAPFLGPVASTEFGPVQLVKPRELFTPEQLAVLTHQMSGAAT